jgi:hypothetical protein
MTNRASAVGCDLAIQRLAAWKMGTPARMDTHVPDA